MYQLCMHFGAGLGLYKIFIIMTIICEIFFVLFIRKPARVCRDFACYLRVCNRDIVGIEPERLTD
jgi:hypothetical protein